MMKAIEQIIGDAAPHWVGDGFPVRSLFSYREAELYDPFLLLDYAGPHEFGPAETTRGVGEHPHRGFETVTIVYQGELEHRDSAGGRGTIGAGDVQWMTAASGVVHEEYHGERFSREGGVLEMVQLWVNLPAKDKQSPPRYQELLSERIPKVSLPGDVGEVRVIAGEFGGTRGAARTFTPLGVLDLRLRAEGAVRIAIPEGHTALLLLQQGRLEINETNVVEGVTLVRFSRQGADVAIAARADSRALILHGEPIEEPVVAQGPFVMNTREEILQAIADYQAGRIGGKAEDSAT